MSPRVCSRPDVALCGPCRISQWPSPVTRKLVRRSLGEEVYVFSGTAGHKSLSKEFPPPFTYLSPGLAGTEDCES